MSWWPLSSIAGALRMFSVVSNLSIVWTTKSSGAGQAVKEGRQANSHSSLHLSALTNAMSPSDFNGIWTLELFRPSKIRSCWVLYIITCKRALLEYINTLQICRTMKDENGLIFNNNYEQVVKKMGRDRRLKRDRGDCRRKDDESCRQLVGWN